MADYRYPPEFRSAKASDVTYDYALLRLEDGLAYPQYIDLGLDYTSMTEE